MRNEKLHSESGAVFIEIAIVAPIMAAIWIFLVDFYFLSTTMTSMTQAVRDAGIYYATDQNYQSLGAARMTIPTDAGTSWTQFSKTAGEADCATVNDPSINPMKSVSERVYYLLQGQDSYLNMSPSAQSGFEIITTNDGNKVTIQITSKLNSMFYFKNKVLEKTVVLRRMGPNCSSS